MEPITFEAVVREGRGGGAYVEVPFDVKATFGSGRPRVVATFEGHTYRGSVASMGGAWLLGITREMRSAIGKDVGDTVLVTLAPDESPRVVEVPEDLAGALEGEPEARAFFEGLAYTYRKEYARWIAGAKREETRRRRIEQAIEKLRRGERAP